jgi:serine/threonine protein kinase
LEESETKEKADRAASATIRFDAQASLIGSLLDGRYLVKRKLGEGGFGVVYLASDEKMMSRPVVVKCLHDAEMGNEWSLRKFRQEMEALARIDHPSIVGVLDSGQLPEGKPYLVMQYIDGCSLRSLITHQGMDFWRAANIIRQVGRALTTAHERGILHRDLKPENIMVQTLGDGEEQVKIIDFGIAKVKNSVVSATSVGDRTVGTIAYMSPEQLSAGPVSTASDVYCFAVIAYEMLTGRRPANPESAYQLLEMQRAGVRIKPIDLRPGLPELAQSVILKGLSFDAAARQQRARDFGDLLSSSLIGDDEQTVLATLAPSSAEESNQAGSAGVGASAISPDQVSGVETLEAASASRATREPQLQPASKRFSKRTVASAVALLALLGILGYLILKPRFAAPPEATPAVVAPPLRVQWLSYWLTVQKTVNDKPTGDPFDSAGQEIFGNGWRFRFHLQPLQAGALYLLNEGPGADNKTEYNVLFPNPADNKGVARLAADQKLDAGWFRFVEQTGVEKIWMIWTAEPALDLDAIFLNAGQHGGKITDAGQIATLQNYLKDYEAHPPEVTSHKAQKRTLVKGKGELVVNLIELSHEPY